MLKEKAGKKPVAMELGGNAACLVDADADLDDAVARIVFGGFYQSGQSCISVQRVLVHERWPMVSTKPGQVLLAISRAAIRATRRLSLAR
jgi:acyl-CoA reductase-like NAD-dependent aldehyde dehydrogenase